MLEFLIDYIYICHVSTTYFQQTVSIPMGTNCATFLIDLLLYSYNSKFGDFVDRIYRIELEIKDTTDTTRPASYLDLHLQIDSENRLRTRLYNNRIFHFFHSELSIYM